MDGGYLNISNPEKEFFVCDLMKMTEIWCKWKIRLELGIIKTAGLSFLKGLWDLTILSALHTKKKNVIVFLFLLASEYECESS